MHITKRNFCDFIVWTPKDIAIVRVDYSKDFFEKMMLPYLKRFYYLAIVPEIVDRTNMEGKAFKEWWLNQEENLY